MLMLMVTHRFVDPVFFNPTLALQSVLLYHHIHTLEPTPINHNNGVTYCNAARARNLGADSSQQSRTDNVNRTSITDNVCCCATRFSNHCSPTLFNPSTKCTSYYHFVARSFVQHIQFPQVGPHNKANLHLVLMVLLHSSTCMAGQN